MSDRRRNDRRVSDRRHHTTKSTTSNNNSFAWRILTGSVVLLFVVFAWQMYCEFAGTGPEVSDNSEVQVEESNFSVDDFQASITRHFGKKYCNVTMSCLKSGEEKKANRVDSVEPGHAVKHYEKRLADLELSLEQHSEFADKKGTIGWGLKQDIERLKSDPPYFQAQ